MICPWFQILLRVLPGLFCIPEDKLDALKATVGQRVKLGNPLDFQTATWFDYSKLREMFDVL
ncbi:MAG: hypothetical protein Ct9H300mP28_10780 [Pseudomonadota bacterium]|nr:MAG: hypothetical protein Ct9H300mP28_10780 [Pseudomonadota bacterium]